MQSWIKENPIRILSVLVIGLCLLTGYQVKQISELEADRISAINISQRIMCLYDTHVHRDLSKYVTAIPQEQMYHEWNRNHLPTLEEREATNKRLGVEFPKGSLARHWDEEHACDDVLTSDGLNLLVRYTDWDDILYGDGYTPITSKTIESENRDRLLKKYPYND